MINAQTELEDKPRFDFINSRPLPSEVEDQLIVNFSAAYKAYDAIFVADQAETDMGGVITPALREVIADVAEKYNAPPRQLRASIVTSAVGSGWVTRM